MLLLALDTSTRQSSVALCTEDELLGEYLWNAGGNHSVELLEYIQRLCASSQVLLPQLDAVVVASGPGSFNGVRVALATAKSLAFALKKTLLSVTTLDCIAAGQQQYNQGPICALLEAGRGELYAACYVSEMVRADNGLVSYRQRRLGEYLLLSPQQIVTHVRRHSGTWFPNGHPTSSWLFCGEIQEHSRQVLSEAFSEQALFVDAACSARRASTLAGLGRLRLQAGEQDDPLTLEPFYLRRPSITKSTRKQPLFGSAAQQSSGGHDTEREEGALRH